MALSLGLNLLLLLAMVATNLLSLYHLSTLSSSPPSSSFSSSSSSSPLLQQQISHLSTIRSTIAHLTNLRSSSSSHLSSSSSSSSSSDLALYASFASIASACHDHPDLLRRFMAYTPFHPCPPDPDHLADSLSIRGCHPLPRRRCFSPSPSPNSVDPSRKIPNSADPFPKNPNFADPFPDWSPNSPACEKFPCQNPDLGFSMAVEAKKFLPPAKSNLDLTVPELLAMAGKMGSPIRVGIDLGGGSGTFAARMKVAAGAVVVTTTLDLGAPFSAAVAARGLVPLHTPLQQRIPVHDGALDLVRCGRAVNRWIPVPVLEFLIFDVDRVLRSGGFLWIDHFFAKSADFDREFAPIFKKLGYRTLKWSVGNKTDSSGVRNGDLYLTALMQKPTRG
ncbi:S-adenosyl-L-methionine-dependent methyltransferases superfamily protein [Wolffia australiana]